MHIKSMTIRGFKTYRNETVISDFSSHVNMVLGKNGSGKSNLLDAIQFVLSDKYVGLRSAERDALLHKGAGRETMQADVEIVFDNSDRQIPLDPPKGDKDNTDVKMRRTIGGKKDQLLVNNVPYTQADFQQLLESTGMSRSNPYYIVEQGKISQLMKQSKAARLSLFQDIAGTKVYDDRKRESQKIMKETDSKRAHIDDVISTLEDRLKELEAESKEFKQYQELDTTRRSLEYSIYDHEREIAHQKLEEIDQKRAGSNTHAEKEAADYEQAVADVQKAEEQIDALKSAIQKAQAYKRSLTTSYSSHLSRRTQLELSLKDLKERMDSLQGGKAEAGEAFKKLQKKIKDTQAKLESVNSELSAILAEEEKLETSYQRADQRLADVCGKRERGQKHKSKAARDADLKKTLTKVKKQREESQRQVDKLTEELSESQSAASKLEADMGKKDKTVEANRAQSDKINAQLVDLAKSRDAATNTRKETWKREAEIKSKLAEVNQTIHKAEDGLRFTMDKDLFRGVEAVRKIAAELNLPGVYGSLIELFTCKPEFHQCVEITAGNTLFNVVVDTNETASTVIQELNRRKAGRVTFIPLADITPQRPEYPATPDALPMIKQLQFDPKYEKAFLQTFGKTLIARELGVAATLSRDYNLNTITLAGDRVDKKGALTGGYNDASQRSRLQAQGDIVAAKQALVELNQALEQVQTELRANDTAVQRAENEITKLTEQKAHLRSQNTQFSQDISAGKRELKALQDQAARAERTLPSLRATLASLISHVDSLEAEMASDFRSGLTADEEAELKRLTLEVDEHKAALVKLRQRKSEIEASKAELESLLHNNLLRTEDQLNARLNAATQEDDKDILVRDQAELATIVALITDAETQIKKADQQVEADSAKVRTLEKELESLRSKESDAAHQLSADAKNMDKLMNSRLIYLSKRDDCLKKIRELGALPNEAFDKYKNMDIKKLMSKLEKTNSEIKKMAGVNKKAMDQYTSFTEEKASLMERKKELDTSRVAIEGLITHLDMKKDEGIDRTFKTIAKHFSEVFAELVPNGKATLVIETRALDGEAEEHDEDGAGLDEEEEEEEEKKSSDKRKKKKAKKHTPKEYTGTASYTGIGIKVSFTGVSSATHQLSGGQESVVALSLIFAIQRCDPSPFYLLDEIDSALDPVHRTAVSDMLKKQSVNTQFICTTFHPELLTAADKFFGVTFKNSASFVRTINEEEAMQLIRVAEKQHEGE